MKELLLLILVVPFRPILALYGSNHCVLFHSVTNLKKKCDGFDVFVERNFTNECAFDECPPLGINPASVGDSYKGNGICWDYPGWLGIVNSANVNLASNSPNLWVPECWWFGPDGQLNHDEIDTTNSVDCNADFTDEADRLHCWCRQPLWESGTIAGSDGVGMLSACCVCGGGLDYDPTVGPPTELPTIPPTETPTEPPTSVTIPEGKTPYYYHLDFVEAMYDPEKHQSSFFKSLVEYSISQGLEILLSEVHITSVEQGDGVVVNFYVLDDSVDPIESGPSIAHMVYDGLIESGNNVLDAYDGFTTASMKSGDGTSTGSKSESNTAKSVVFGIVSGFTMLLIILAVNTAYKKRQSQKVASANRFVFKSDNV